jgi:hypothetical protein
VTAARQLVDQAVTGSAVLGDKSYDVDWIVDLVQNQGGRANIHCSTSNFRLEAGSGIEPLYEDLQSSA